MVDILQKLKAIHAKGELLQFSELEVGMVISYDTLPQKWKIVKTGKYRAILVVLRTNEAGWLYGPGDTEYAYHSMEPVEPHEIELAKTNGHYDLVDTSF